MPGSPTSRCWPIVSSSAPMSSPWRASGSGGEIRHTTLELLGIERSLLDAARRLRHGRPRASPIVQTWSRRSIISLCSPASRLRWSAPHELGGWRRSRGGQGRGRQDPGPRRGTDVVGIEWLPGARHRAVGPGGPRTARRGRHRVRRPWPRCWPASSRAEPSSAPATSSSSTRPAWWAPGRWPTCRRRPTTPGPRWSWSEIPASCPRSKPVGRWPRLIDRVGAIELTENRRQQSTWERVALDALRTGRADVALATYERAGRIHAAPTMAEAQEALVERWAESFREGHDAVMLAASRREVGVLNELARAELRRSGRLGIGPARGGRAGVRRGRQGDLSAQRPTPRRVERHDRHRRAPRRPGSCRRDGRRTTSLAERHTSRPATWVTPMR